MSKEADILIVAYCRTPIGSYQGCLSHLSAVELGAHAIRGLLDGFVPHGMSVKVDQVILGNALAAGLGQCPATQAALQAGLAPSTVAYSVNKVCASGMKAIAMASGELRSGGASVVIAGGMESMSNVPHYLAPAKGTNQSKRPYGNILLVDGLQLDGLTDCSGSLLQERDSELASLACPVLMGHVGEACARHHRMTRQLQDDAAIASYKRSIEAAAAGYTQGEICSISAPATKAAPPTLIELDESLSLFNEPKMRVLRGSFALHPGHEATITAGNAPALSDGASALLLMRRSEWRKYVSVAKEETKTLAKPLARIVGSVDSSHSPEHFPTAPHLAIKSLLEKCSLALQDIDYFEINEAFSFVPLLNMQLLLACFPEATVSLDALMLRVNVHGGAVSLGHPLGSSGSRIVGTLARTLVEKGKRYGIAAICNGGGGASAMLLESYQE